MILNEIFASEQIGFPILSVLLFLPLIFVVVLHFIRDDHLAYQVGLAGACIELLLACVMAFRFIPGIPDMQFMERGFRIPYLGVGYHLGVDGISVLFIPVTALLTVMVILYAEYAVKSDARHYAMATLALEATMIGAFVSLDMMLFWLFFVVELVPSYFLITRWGTGAHRQRAAREYVAFMITGSVLMLVGIALLGVYYHNASLASGQGSGYSFDFLHLLAVPVPEKLQTLIFFLIFFGLAVKTPIFPFHTWMPKVLEEGPIVGMSVFLVGIKLGTYGFIRLVIPLLPEAAKEWFWLMALLGAIGVIYGALIALIQTNLRRMVAFSSLSHMGVVMLAIFSLNFYGFQGALLQMINLGITGAGLFFFAGFLHTRVGPPDTASLGGLVHNVPLLTATFLILALAGVGLPGTNGFNGEHLVILGTFQQHWYMALAAGVGTFLTAAYFLWYFQRAFMGSLNPSIHKMPDLRPREMFIVAVLGAMIFWIGLDTGPLLRRMNGSLQALAIRVEQGSYVEPRSAAAVNQAGGDSRDSFPEIAGSE